MEVGAWMPGLLALGAQTLGFQSQLRDSRVRSRDRDTWVLSQAGFRVGSPRSKSRNPRCLGSVVHLGRG